jgi:FAD/FMN-containing dehydrogenase
MSSDGMLQKIVNMDGANRQDCSGTVAWAVVRFGCNQTEGRMEAMETSHERALRDLEEVFGDRLKRAESAPLGVPDVGDALASVSPMNAEEVKLLAEVAGRYSVPLVALGAGTASMADVEGRSILIHFDLMRSLRLPEHEEPWVEAEPGVSWLQLDDPLRTRGWGLAVYPTSAPRSTVGGWLAMDGLGVGSFEYGWLSENVLSARVVLPGGELVEASGEKVRSFVEPGASGIIVGAKLRTRRAHADVPFGAAFGSADELTGAVASIAEIGLPLWHLAFLNPGMAHARNLGENFLLFGAYPTERAGEVDGRLHSVLGSSQGSTLSAAEAHRAWGERFFPVTPSVLPPQFPALSRDLVSLADFPQKLSEVEDRPGIAAIQGTVARSGEVLLLSLEDHEEDPGR